MENHIDKFQTLISEASYTDLYTIRNKLEYFLILCCFFSYFFLFKQKE